MKIDDIYKLMEEHKAHSLKINGFCWNCGADVTIYVYFDSDKLVIEGGAMFKDKGYYYMKCDECYKQENALTNFRPCEVYSRIVGYMTPVKSWNPGKKAEFEERKVFENP